jgi:hypothetical protein
MNHPGRAAEDTGETGPKKGSGLEDPLVVLRKPRPRGRTPVAIPIMTIFRTEGPFDS